MVPYFLCVPFVPSLIRVAWMVHIHANGNFLNCMLNQCLPPKCLNSAVYPFLTWLEICGYMDKMTVIFSFGLEAQSRITAPSLTIIKVTSESHIICVYVVAIDVER